MGWYVVVPNVEAQEVEALRQMDNASFVLREGQPSVR
jgi:hypothetical protein